MDTVINTSRDKTRRATIAIATALLVAGVVVATTGCNGKDRPTPTPPEPKPTPETTLLALNLTNKGLILEDKLESMWQENETIQFWSNSGGKALSLKGKWKAEKGWLFDSKIEKEWSKAEEVTIAVLRGASYNPTTKTFTPLVEKNKVVGNFTVPEYYKDALLTKVMKTGNYLNTTLASPFKQVRIIIKNTPWEQKVKSIKVTIEGSLTSATYKEDKWIGAEAPLNIAYNEDKLWKGNDADTILLALPTNATELKATLTYKEDNNTERKVEQVITLQNTLNNLLLTLPTEKGNNPPLAFTTPIDVAYWKEANRKSMELLMANYAGELTEEEARKFDWVNIRPLVDELMHSKILYKDDANIIGWRTEKKEALIYDNRDWGLIFGLETMDGQLVEVYPPLYFNTLGGMMGNGIVDGFYDLYCYVTAPAGKYRLVCFAKEHMYEVGETKSRLWYKLPMLDSRNYWETGAAFKWDEMERNEPIPMEKSIYKDLEIIEVVDRATSTNVAPRWRMGVTYNNKPDYENNRPSYDYSQAEIFRKIGVGTIFEVTAVNNSNNTIKGTIVAKCEYLPMSNPIGYWRFDIYNKILEGYGGYDGSKHYSSWSHEVGKTEVSIPANSEQKVAIEMLLFSSWWFKDGESKGIFGPENYVHFYWKDENGNEELMKRVDYTFLENAEKAGFGEPITNLQMNFERGNSIGWEVSWREYEVGYGPVEGISLTNANGFLFI